MQKSGNNITIINEFNPISNYQKPITQLHKDDQHKLDKNKIKNIKKYINLTTTYPILYFIYGFLTVIFMLGILMFIMHNTNNEVSPLKDNYNYLFCSKIL